MARWHINEKGNPGLCKATEEGRGCPFGGNEVHFSTEEAARAAYESQQRAIFHKQTPQEKFPYYVAGIGKAPAGLISSNGRFYGARKKLLKFLEEGGQGSEALIANPDYQRLGAQPVLSAPKPSPKLSEKLAKDPVDESSFSTAILASVPDPEDSKVLVSPAAADNYGYMGGRRFIGGKAQLKDAQGKSIYIGQTEAAKGIRDTIKAAKKVGELPSWVNVSVRKNSGSMVTSITVEIGMKRKLDGRVRAIPQEWLYEGGNNNQRRKLTPAAAKLEAYIGTAARQYEYSDTNPMVDYFNSYNAGRVSWRSSWKDGSDD